MQWLAGKIGLLIEWLYDFTEMMGFPSYGWAIIFLTIILKIVLFPFSIKQGKALKKQQLLAPRIEQIQNQYKNNPEIATREMQALYKKYDASPMSGCLPMLLQLPILWALFSCLRTYEFVKPGVQFFWLQNMNDPDSTWILPIIVALASFAQSYITQKSQPQNGVGDQAKTMTTVMLYGFPIMMAFMAHSMPAGLGLYWVVYSITGVIQQLIINVIVERASKDLKNEIEDETLRAEIEKSQKIKERQEAREAARKAREAERLANPPKSSSKKANNNNGSDRGKPLNFD